MHLTLLTISNEHWIFAACDLTPSMRSSIWGTEFKLGLPTWWPLTWGSRSHVPKSLPPWFFQLFEYSLIFSPYHRGGNPPEGLSAGYHSFLNCRGQKRTNSSDVVSSPRCTTDTASCGLTTLDAISYVRFRLKLFGTSTSRTIWVPARALNIN